MRSVGMRSGPFGRLRLGGLESVQERLPSVPPRSRRSNEWSAVNTSSVSGPTILAVRSIDAVQRHDAIEAAADPVGVAIPLDHQEVAARVARQDADRAVHRRLEIEVP